MALFTNDGLDYLNRYVLGLFPSFEMRLRLFTNNYVPTVLSTLVNFDECTAAGYGAITFVSTNWSGATVGGVCTYNYPQQTFIFGTYTGAPVTVFGYFVTFDVPNIVVFAEASAVSFTIPFAGGQILITPQWIDQNL